MQDRLRETAAELSHREEKLKALELSAHTDSLEAVQRLQIATECEKERASAAISAEILRQQLNQRLVQADRQKRALDRALEAAQEQATAARKV